MKQSLWLKEVQLREFPTLEGDLKTDVLIIGGGLAGILCVYELQQRGIDCVLIEADRIFRHTSGNTTAKLTSQHGLIYGKLLKEQGREGAIRYWQANESALSKLRALCLKNDCDFREEPNYIYSTEVTEPLEGEMTALDALGIPAELVINPGLPFPVSGAIRFPNQGRFHPGKLAAALVSGMRIFEKTRALDIRGNRVRTDRGVVTAEKIIVATHFPFLNRHGLYFMKMYQQRSYVLALENAKIPEGMFLDCAENGLSLRMQGQYLLLGGGGHRTGMPGGGWEMIEKAAKQWFPGSKIRCRWAAQDCVTLDGMPYIGQYGRCLPHVYVATGFNKWGMTTSMMAAQILRDLVQGRRNAYASLFDPARPVNGKIFSNLGHSALHLLKPKAPRCSHMGCALEWNKQEHSWDCPCHGSRYSGKGELLDNPAQKSIEKRESV